MSGKKDDPRFDAEFIRRSFMSSDIPPANEKPLDPAAPTNEPCEACMQCKVCGGTRFTTRPRNAWFRWAIGLEPKR